MSRESCPLARQDGFTLVEILVACALFTILMALVLATVSGSTSLTSTATQQLIVSRTARESLDEIGHDLSQASLPWQRTSTGSLQLYINPSGIVPAMDANPDAIFWQAPLAHGNDYGNQAVVGYFVLRDLQASAPATTRLQLRKIFISPTIPTTPGNYLIYSSPNAWMTASLLAAFAPTTTALDISNAEEGWMADGVLGLWVRCLDKLGNPITLDSSGTTINSSTVNTYDSRKAYKQATGSSGYYNYPGTTAAGLITAHPAFIQVCLVCMSPAEINRIKTLPTAPSTNAANFDAPIDAYVLGIMSGNHGVKSVTKFSRIFRLYESD